MKMRGAFEKAPLHPENFYSRNKIRTFIPANIKTAIKHRQPPLKRWLAPKTLKGKKRWLNTIVFCRFTANSVYERPPPTSDYGLTYGARCANDHRPPSKETSKSGTVGFADGVRAPQSRLRDEKRSEHLMRKSRFSKTPSETAEPFFFFLFPSGFSCFFFCERRNKRNETKKHRRK